ncbi:MAG TPA: hypothetical protein VMW87_10830 [Spirochaetia bacterium]|nr:hypothetical protein [Spirochaetia bacterium]
MAEKKLPRPFNRPIPESRYLRKVLGRVYLEPDREYLKSLFAADEVGMVRLVREPTDDERKRIRKIAKEVRRNRGVVQKGKLTILIIIIAGVAVFDLAFKNILVTRAGDQLLESAFGARSNLSGVDFRPLRGSISFSSLTVADKSRPMMNLFELGSTRMDVDTLRLLGGHLIITRMEAKGIRWGTPRKISGALTQAPSSRAPSSQGKSDPTAAGSSGGVAVPEISSVLAGLNIPVPGSFDAKKFVESHAQDLKSVTKITEITSRADTLTQIWKDRVAALASDAQAAAGRASELSSIDVNGIKSLDAAVAAYKQVQDAGAVISKTSTEAQTAYDAANADISAFAAQAAAIPGLVSADSRYLVSLVPDISTGGREILTKIVEVYVRAAIGSWYDRLLQGYGVVTRLADQKTATEKPRTRRLPGRTVVFPSAALPRFWLKQASFDAADTTQSLTLAGRVLDVTSDPDLIGMPASFDFQGRSGAASLEVRGEVDGRKDAADRVSVAASTSGQPLDISGGLEGLEISSVKGNLKLSTGITLMAGGGAAGRVQMEASSLAVTGTYARDSFGGILADVLQQDLPLEAAFDYRVAPDGSISFPSGTTNLDQAVNEVLKSRAKQITDALQARVKTELDGLIAAHQPEIDAAKAQAESVRSAVRNQLDTVAAAGNQVESVQKQLDARTAAIKNQAQQQLQNQLNSLQKGVKIPGLGQ